MLNINSINDTIVAIATPNGSGAIAVIRLSGGQAIEVVHQVFFNKGGKQLLNQKKSHSIHFGTIRKNNELIDEVLVSIFKSPNTYTGEDIVEISCHGSIFIQQEIMKLMLHQGARLAAPGEFTKRAFLNRKMDLSQAEAVADLIASDNLASHQLAIHQLRGGFGKDIDNMRQQLIDFAALVELELDFSEEDVAFADRSQLEKLIHIILKHLQQLSNSFEAGNAHKSGIPVAIVGKPNAGKSTLLNTFLNEEKAIVSEIAGTTRDFIEDKLVIGGMSFRLIDTAGLRKSEDIIEEMGIKKTYQKIDEAALILYLYDSLTIDKNALREAINELKALQKPYLLVANKADIMLPFMLANEEENTLIISASQMVGIEELKNRMLDFANKQFHLSGNIVVSNLRHYQAIEQTIVSLQHVLDGMQQQLSGELLAWHIRDAIKSLSEITGQITTDDLLGSIFSRFCIGK